MNTRKIGSKFEKEALNILKSKFDSVVWDSEKYRNTTFDFECTKDGKTYYGDAKFINDSNGSVQVRYSQKDFDFIIAKIGKQIHFITKDNLDKFKGKIYIDNYDFGIVPVRPSTHKKLEQLKIKLKMNTYDDVIQYLLNKEVSQ